MKLYQFAWGLYPRRVHVYIKEKNISGLEMVELDVISGENRNPEYLAMNPTGSIPMLEADNGSFICQSSSILLYLEERHPAKAMAGSTPEQRAQITDLIMLLNEAYNFAGICTYYGSPLFAHRRTPNDVIAKAMYDDFARVMENVEAMAGDGDYFGGKQPNIADITLFASEQFMRTIYRLQLPKTCVKLEAMYQRFLTRPSATAPDYPPIVLEHGPLRMFR